MCNNPLSDYFALSGVKAPFKFRSTALWRGYVGTWEIVDDRLYLVELKGTLAGGIEASVATIFPEFPNRVFAHWYTGTIRLPGGKLLRYVHGGYRSIYELDRLLEIEHGVLKNTQLRHNGTAPLESGAAGYQLGGMTVLSGLDKGGGEVV